MKLDATWMTVATRRGKDAPWAWALNALERIVLTKMIDERKADVRVDRRPGGLQYMHARDRAAALVAKSLGSGHAEAVPVSVESPAAPVSATPPAPRPAVPAFRHWRVPVVPLPRARPVAPETYAPFSGEAARWTGPSLPSKPRPPARKFHTAATAGSVLRTGA